MILVLFGQYLLKKGLVTNKDINEACSLQRKHCQKIGRKAREDGLLSGSDIAKITREQGELGSKFGETAEKLKLLTHEQVSELLDKQKREYMLFGEALVLSGVLSEAVVKRELKRFCEEREEFWKKFFKIH